MLLFSGVGMSDSEPDQSDDKLDVILKELISFKKSTAKEFEVNKKLSKQILLDITSLKKELNCLKTEVANQKVKLDEQNNKINFLEKQLLKSTINIPNIPKIQEEVLTDIVYAIAQKAELKLTTSSISSIYRKKEKKSGSPGDIIVNFNNISLHDNFIDQVKKRKLKLSDIGFKGDQNKLYINHELTILDKNIFFEARKIQKVKGWKYVWEKAGYVYIRKKEDGQAERISSIDQLKL